MNLPQIKLLQKERGAAPLLILFASIGIIVFTLITSTFSFQNLTFSNLFFKPPSQANQLVSITDASGAVLTQTTTPQVKVLLNAPWPIQPPPPNLENMRASMRYLPDKTTLKVGELLTVSVMIKTDLDQANLFATNLVYPSDRFDFVSFNTSDSVIQLWVEQKNSPPSPGSNLAKITLIGGIPTPGLKTTTTDALFAKVILRAKNPGLAEINPDVEHGIYRDSDNVNIFDTRIDPAIKNISIVAADSSIPVAQNLTYAKAGQSALNIKFDVDCLPAPNRTITGLIYSFGDGTTNQSVTLTPQASGATIHHSIEHAFQRAGTYTVSTFCQDNTSILSNPISISALVNTSNSSSSPSPTINNTNCRFNSASWVVSRNPIAEKSVVLLKATGNASCAGSKVDFEVRQSDPLGISQAAAIQPISSVFVGDSAYSAWITKYVPDLNGLADPPDYYFIASITNINQSISSGNPILRVNRRVATDILKGDGNKDGRVDKTADISVLFSHYNKTTPPPPPEIDIIEDGVINAQDFSGTILLLKEYDLLTSSPQNLSNSLSRLKLVPETNAQQPSPSPTPVNNVFIKQAVLAEDAQFTTNPLTITFDTNPKTVDYTFSDTTFGTKTLFVRFISTDPLIQAVETSTTVELVDPDAVPTPTPTTDPNIDPTPTPDTNLSNPTPTPIVITPTPTPLATPTPTPTPIPPPTFKRVFITSFSFGGDLKSAGGALNGLSGADNLCINRATSANLGGTWKAWLSSKTISASSRLNQVGPWRLVDGVTVVASSWTQLTSGLLQNNITKTELGTTLTGERVWTNTLANGSLRSSVDGSTCKDWTDSSNANGGNFGINTSTISGGWTNSGGSNDCTSSSPVYRLYCFEQ